MAAEGTTVVFMTTGPENPERCAVPIYMASLAAAMEHQACVLFQSTGTLLMKRGVAEQVTPMAGGKRILDFIRDAKEIGVRFYCCSSSLELHDMSQADLISECDGLVGGAWMIDQAAEADVTLNY